MSFRRKKNKPAPLEWESDTSSDQQVSTSPRGRLSPLSPLKSPIAKSPTSASAKSPTSRRNSGNLAYLASRRNSNSTTTTLSTNTSPLHSPTNPPHNYQRRRRQSNFLELPVLEWPQRKQRVSSLPINNPRNYFRRHLSDDEDDEDENVLMYRLRSFNITNNRVVNCGDSILPRFDGGKLINKQRSNNSSRNSPMHSNNSPSESLYDFCEEEEEEINRFRVILLGHTSVGKSALVTQFMTSDYINTYDASLDDEFGERTVSVLLDGLESELIFIDHPASEMSAENSLTTYNPHGCIVVYSVTDRHSYEIAGDILRYLWQESITQEKAVILVGNKCDLERAREVPMQEGKNLATSHDAKFIETSSGIQHNVDELLVGTLKQCRLRQQKNTKKLPRNLSFFSIHELARELISKLCKHEVKKKQSKSCQNLHVL